ncbi:MAG: Slp family lipoprotein [Pseudomonadota bacterium]
MAFKRVGKFLCIFLITLSLGCAAGISPKVRSQVTYAGTFSDVQKAPDEYIGKIVIFGGKILNSQASPSASELTVLHLRIDSRDRPKDGDQSEGRYLIQSDQFLDPAIYKKEALLTVAGRITGGEVRAIGGFDYVYPKLKAIEIKLWPEADRIYPRFHIGIGVGKTF